MIFKKSETVELKAKADPDICKAIIAFANTTGGIIYIGADDKGRIIGIDKADEVISWVKSMILKSIKPDVSMYVSYDKLSFDDKHVVSVSVQKGSGRPYYLSGKGMNQKGVYVRRGTFTVPADENFIQKMYIETNGCSFEEMRSAEQNLTFDTAREVFAKGNIPFDKASMQSLGFFSSDGLYSNVALICSDQCPVTVNIINRISSEFGKYFGSAICKGSVFRHFEKVYEYIDVRNNTKTKSEGATSIGIRDYPPDAVREALLNAIVHRDYSNIFWTSVDLMDDSIDILSVGGIAEGLSSADITHGVSICRNPRLAAIFKHLNLIELGGTGIPKIMSAYAGSGLEPEIKAIEIGFRITLPNRNAGDEDNQAESFVKNASEAKDKCPSDAPKNAVSGMSVAKYIESIMKGNASVSKGVSEGESESKGDYAEYISNYTLEAIRLYEDAIPHKQLLSIELQFISDLDCDRIQPIIEVEFDTGRYIIEIDNFDESDIDLGHEGKECANEAEAVWNEFMTLPDMDLTSVAADVKHAVESKYPNCKVEYTVKESD